MLTSAAAPASLSLALPVALYCAEQVRALDAALIGAGTPGFQLMQQAALAAWQALLARWPKAQEITVLAGAGNNAGDGYLLALLAQQAGWRVRVLAVSDPQRLSGDAARARALAGEGGVEVFRWAEYMPLQGVVVDALLGTGLSGPVRESYASAIRQANGCGLPLLALDLPSGLCADTGRVLGEAIRADLTVTFIALKLGLFCAAGPEQCGELLFAGLQADLRARDMPLPAARRLDGPELPRLPARRRDAHKGQFGHVLVVGGDTGFGGAVLLAAEAALRAGAGLVSLATRPAHVPALLARRPEVMGCGLEHAGPLAGLAAAASVLVLGPGLGQGDWGCSLLAALAGHPALQVWDADALNLLAAGRVAAPQGNWLMTPHPGEAARLLGWTVAQVQDNRPAAARELARRWRAGVVLKGAGTLVACVDGSLWLCDRGHPAMAAPGLGDVLAGLLGALLAQGMGVTEAARLGTWLHACAGERLATLDAGWRPPIWSYRSASCLRSIAHV